MHCLRNTLLSYDFEWTCRLYEHNVIKRENQLTEFQRKTKF